MPERGFDTGFWSDPFVQKLPLEGKLLFAYLWTNRHCNQAGLYQITPSTIAFETKLAEADIPPLLQKLEPKVIWNPEEDFVWVKNFLRHQAKSPKFVIAAIKSLNSCSVPEDLRAEFELYNQKLLRGIAPSEHISLTKRECVLIRDNFYCQYCGKEIQEAVDYEMDHVIPVIKGGKDNYLNLAASCRSCNQKKFDKTPAEAGLQEPKPSAFHGAQATYILRNSELVRKKWLAVFPERVAVVGLILGNIEPTLPTSTNIQPSQFKIPSNANASAKAKAKAEGVGVVKGKGELSSGEKEIIGRLVKLKGWQADEDDVHWLQGLRSEFPGFTLAEFKACVDYYSGRAPPKHKGIWKNRFRNWMIKKKEFESAKVKKPGWVPTEEELDEQEKERGLR